MKIKCAIYFTFLVLLCSNAAADPIVNGDFSSGFSGWSGSGIVNNSGFALLEDNDGYALLYQGAALAPGNYTLDFDFTTILSELIPQGTFADSFYASLYFVDDISTFDLAALSFDDVVPLIDLSGPLIDWGGGTVTTVGNGWLHYSIGFSNSYQYAIPVFELFDLNFILGDSRIEIDNVAIGGTAVPEPASALLLAAVLGAAVLRKKRL